MSTDTDSQVIEMAETLFNLTSISTRCYKNNKRIAFFSPDRELEEMHDFFQPFMGHLDNFTSPIGCITTPHQFTFGFVRHESLLFVLGPVKNTPTSDEMLKQITEDLDSSGKYRDRIFKQLNECPKLSSYAVLPLIAHVYKLLNFGDNERSDKYLDIFLSSTIEITLYDESSAKITSKHCSLIWLFEKIIEEGNIAALEEWYKANPLMHFGITITGEDLRDAIDCFILMTSLYVKAASLGGLDRQYAMRLQLDAIRAAEKMTDPKDVLKLQTELTYDLTKEVAAGKKTTCYSKLVQDAIQIINRDIYGTINTEDIAKELFVSRGHLSRKFHDETGTGLNDFIRDMKIREAKKLLTHSTVSLEEISSLLGFSTQSYFTKVFREATGTTPRHYRISER